MKKLTEIKKLLESAENSFRLRPRKNKKYYDLYKELVKKIKSKHFTIDVDIKDIVNDINNIFKKLGFKIQKTYHDKRWDSFEVDLVHSNFPSIKYQTKRFVDNSLGITVFRTKNIICHIKIY